MVSTRACTFGYAGPAIYLLFTFNSRGEMVVAQNKVCWDRAALARLGSLQELPLMTVQPPLIYGGGRPAESQPLEMTLS